MSFSPVRSGPHICRNWRLARAGRASAATRPDLGFGEARPWGQYDHLNSASGLLAVKVLGRAIQVLAPLGKDHAPDLLYCFGQALGRRRPGSGARHRRPNNALKPTPHRGANHMAGRACHVLHAPLRRGLA